MGDMENKMRNMWGVLILTLFLFAFASQCRPHKQQQLHFVGSPRRGQQQAYYILTNTRGDDERKLTLKFCTLEGCDGWDCYCCHTEKPYPKCYSSLQECRVVCPTCNPKCPPV
ncbi:hypothetical protein U9M48_040988 [Paspalum notatum var. saurae]|uniref:Embryo surrounding factor 1 brassicaceae domain-containing protein n=1 Tax=Paspalum notatum var. saurae TaxID=547442 RepID=A0AAQ3US87_PASNO